MQIIFKMPRNYQGYRTFLNTKKNNISLIIIPLNQNTPKIKAPPQASSSKYEKNKVIKPTATSFITNTFHIFYQNSFFFHSILHH